MLQIVGEHQFDSQCEAAARGAKLAQALNPTPPRKRTVAEIVAERTRLTDAEKRWTEKLASARAGLKAAEKRLAEIEAAVDGLSKEPQSSQRDARLQQLIGYQFTDSAERKVHADGERDVLLERAEQLRRDVGLYVRASHMSKKALKSDWPSDEELAAAKKLESL